MSAIADKNILSEYHCRELEKISNPEIRQQTFDAVIESGDITEKKIQQTARQIKLDKANQRNSPVLPEIGSAIKLNKYHQSYWAIVIEVNEFTVNALTFKGEIKNIPSQDFKAITRCDFIQARELLDRLRTLYQPGLDPTAKLMIKAIASKPIPEITLMESKLLILLEWNVRGKNMVCR